MSILKEGRAVDCYMQFHDKKEIALFNLKLRFM